MTMPNQRLPVDAGKQQVWRRAAFWLAFGILAIVAGGLVAWFSGRPTAALYHGRTLDQYLADLDMPKTSPQFESAREAILKMGTPAIKGIADILDRGIPAPVHWYSDYQSRLPNGVRAWVNRTWHPAKYRDELHEALTAVDLLATNAAPLAKALGRHFARGDYQTQVSTAQVLPKIGPAMIPVMVPFLTEADLRTRGLAAFCFYELGPSGAIAAEQLVAGLNGADNNYRRLVAQTLDRMGPGALPVITNMITSPAPEVRSVGIQALSGMLPRSMETTPSLVHLLDDSDTNVRLQAALTLADWWPMPTAFLREKFASLPAGSYARKKYGPGLNAMDACSTRLKSVLEEGLGAEFELRVRSVERLLALGNTNQQMVACLEEMVRDPRTPSNQLGHLDALLQTIRQGLDKRPVTETGPRPRTVEAGKSPASTAPPPAGK